MRTLLHNDSPPEPVFPPHAKLHPKAPTTLDAVFNTKNLRFPVEVPATEALHHAETAIEAVHHPLDGSVRLLLVNLPKADFVPLNAAVSF
jgi:hypothetical protein